MTLLYILLSGFFSSIEFYVIMAIVAAAIVALAARPKQRGEVQEFLLSSQLMPGDVTLDGDTPSVEFQCLNSGEVRLVRSGIEGVSMSGAVSLAIKYDGIDLAIEERLVSGSEWDIQAREAVFMIDFLPSGRYRVIYNSQKTGLFVAFGLHVAPGIVATRILSR